MDAMECLRARRSVRNFLDKDVPKEIIENMIDAGRLAPTANNLQLWDFIVITGKDIKKRIAGIANYGKFIADAPVCVAVLCKETKYYLEDGSAATENIMLAARAHGIGTCWVAGDKKPYADKILDILQVPAGYKLISLIAAGYPGTKEVARERKRNLKEVLHWEKF
jgi:nitroreductase